ncbi:MAG TPA: 2-phospho-L-lactate transferase CofD family protein [Chloroflexota bacterium]|nr:2-phospho-L-lactate transferase CofD family protein [Chloroflexota bacterium]
MNRRLRTGATVNFWLLLVGIALLLIGSGGTLAIVKTGVAGWVLLGIGIVVGAASFWQLSQSKLGLTLSLMEQQSPGEILVTRQTGHGLPDVVLFSGHMGLLIILTALRDTAERVVAVPAPGGDFRTIAGLLRASHQEVRVLPATAENAQLCARLTNGDIVLGADKLELSTVAPIETVYLTSDGSTPASTGAWPIGHDLEEALATADLVVFGPGSFYTSVVPALLVAGLKERLAAGAAPTVFVCNIMTEPGRTDGWTVADFVREFTTFAGFAPQYTIVNHSYPGANMLSRYEVTGSHPIMVTPEEHIEASKVVLGSSFPGSTTLNIGGSTVIEADIIEVATESRLTFDHERGTTTEHTVSVIRHDPEKLRAVLRGIISQGRSHA